MWSALAEPLSFDAHPAKNMKPAIRIASFCIVLLLCFAAGAPNKLPSLSRPNIVRHKSNFTRMFPRAMSGRAARRLQTSIHFLLRLRPYARVGKESTRANQTNFRLLSLCSSLLIFVHDADPFPRVRVETSTRVPHRPSRRFRRQQIEPGPRKYRAREQSRPWPPPHPPNKPSLLHRW